MDKEIREEFKQLADKLHESELARTKYEAAAEEQHGEQTRWNGVMETKVKDYGLRLSSVEKRVMFMAAVAALVGSLLGPFIMQAF